MAGEATWRPELSIQVAFSSGPNDATSILTPVPIWKDLSALWVGAETVTRGRQYELDQNQAAQPTIAWVDPNEYLNPANTSSPYYPYVTPIRQYLWQATWPNPAAGNLMNSNQPASPAILGTDNAGYDPSFESYTVGSVPPWITALPLFGGGVHVSTTNPQQGTQDLAVTVPTGSLGTDPKGVRWHVPSVPGTTYTVSAYVRQDVANTVGIFVAGVAEAVDLFARTTASGWGTADVGGAWAIKTGTSSDFSTVPGFGQIAPTAVASARIITVGATVVDSVQQVYITVNQVATGGAIRAGLVARYVDTSNYLYAVADFNVDQSITVSIISRIAGVETVVDTATPQFPYTAGQTVGFAFSVNVTTLSAVCWRVTGRQPSFFDPMVLSSSALQQTAGQVGAYGRLQTGNTNSGPHVTYSDYRVSATSAGTTTTTTGSYVRLSKTFTADQPATTVIVSTQMPTTSGNLWIDSVQYEVGSSATTFTTTGSTIYGVFRGFVERWPSEWDNQGFLGLCRSTAVDAFEPLNRYSLNTAFHQQILLSSPVLYWPLNDSSGTTTYGEQSGNNGPPLVNITSKYGAGTLPQAGASLDIPGDPGGSGVTFTPDPVNFATPRQQSTIIGAGSATSPLLTLWPPSGGQPWSGSFVLWVNVETLNTSIPLTIWDGKSVGSSVQLYIETPDYTPHLIFTTPGFTFGADGTSSLNDGRSHMISGTIVQDATNTTCTIWVDDTEEDGETVATSGNIPATPMGIVNVGGWFSTPYGYQGVVNGSISHVALFDYEIDVFNIWGYGAQGGTGQLSGTRILVDLLFAWNGLYAVDAGRSVMGVDPVTSGTPILQACQDITATEQGNFWIDRDGVVRFAGRDDRYLNLTSLVTFGENTAGGEYPYQEGIGFDFDPTFVFNLVQVVNSDGVTATTADTSSQLAFFPRSTQLSANTESDDDAIQLANWVLNKHAEPVQRVASITLDPAAYPLLWPVVLGLEVNDRVTVVRRPKAANGGAGITMTGDFFVEAISHNSVDLAAGVWTTTLLLSPVDLSAGVFIFDNASWGTFDGPGVLGY